jgi:hypothetical protein
VGTHRRVAHWERARGSSRPAVENRGPQSVLTSQMAGRTEAAVNLEENCQAPATTTSSVGEAEEQSNQQPPVGQLALAEGTGDVEELDDDPASAFAQRYGRQCGPRRIFSGVGQCEGELMNKRHMIAVAATVASIVFGAAGAVAATHPLTGASENDPAAVAPP